MSDSSTRNVSGFQEFTKNGKSSICETTDKPRIKVFLRKKKRTN